MKMKMKITYNIEKKKIPICSKLVEIFCLGKTFKKFNSARDLRNLIIDHHFIDFIFNYLFFIISRKRYTLSIYLFKRHIFRYLTLKDTFLKIETSFYFLFRKHFLKVEISLFVLILSITSLST